MAGTTVAARLPKEVAFHAMVAEAAANGIAKHQTFSMDHLLEHHLPAILLEMPEVVADTAHAIHVVETLHVHIDKPVAKTDGGFYSDIDPWTAQLTKNTYANPVLVDVRHSVFLNSPEGKEMGWEAMDARATDAHVRAIEAGRAHGDGRVGGGGTGTPVPPASCPAGTTGDAGAERPRQARRRVPLDAQQTEWRLAQETTYRQVNQFFMPTMTQSIGCRTKDLAPLNPNARYDVPGYFIPKGTAKVIQTQKRLHSNRHYIFPASSSRWSWTCEIRACHAGKIRSTSTLRIHVRCGAHGTGILQAGVEMPYFDKSIPLLAVCRVLGFEDAEAAATCAATGGVLSGRTPIPPGCWWDCAPVHATRKWVLALLRDEASLHPEFPKFEDMPRSSILQWMTEYGAAGRKLPADRAKYAAHLMANEFLPQMGLHSTPEVLARKAQYVGMLLRELADVAREISRPDDRDHAGNRQYDTAGVLCATLARQHYRSFQKKLASEIRRFADRNRFVNIVELCAMKRTSDGFTYALSTGNWGMAKGGSTQTGITQVLGRNNLVASKSHVRRVDAPLRREGKQAKPRQLHVSGFGHMCPAETPEGPACGLVEQMAQGAWITHGHDTVKLVQRTCRELVGVLIPLVDVSTCTGDGARLRPRASIRSPEFRAAKPMALDHPPEDWAPILAALGDTDAVLCRLGPDVTRVLVNGMLVGFVADGEAAAGALRAARRAGHLPFDVAVEEHQSRGILSVTGEAGGMRRPLYVLDPDGGLGRVARLHAECATEAPEVFWVRLLAAGVVEYLSKHEEENALVLERACTPVQLHAPLEDHTHCEIHPQMMLGIAAGLIPFSEHNQAPRTSYYASMCKQTAGCPPPDMQSTNGMRAWYVQHPLVPTWAASIHGLCDMPMGTNTWVAVAAPGGENQEDSLYVNEDSRNRGMFACTITRTITEDCQTGTGADAQQFGRPDPTCLGPKSGNFGKLNASGFVSPGSHVRGGDAIVGRTMVVNELGCVKRGTVKRDQSVILPQRTPTMHVDAVVRTTGRDGKDIVAITAHHVVELGTGDKVTSAHGQKGVVGAVRPGRLMPYTVDGMRPDIVINPHALPSRMTIGQLMESAMGIVCAERGELADGTPFNGTRAEDIGALLATYGFQSTGQHVMYDGATGERIQHELFFGCTYYQRVKQMAADKCHARARGPIDNKTRQPTEGKSKEGGFRMGDMERDCVAAYGAADILRDRFLEQSDYARIPHCTTCGSIAMPQAPAEERVFVANRNEHAGYCLNCRTAGTVVNVQMPYATKLLRQEAAAQHMRLQPTIDVRPELNPYTTAAVGVRRADPAQELQFLQPTVVQPRRQRRQEPKRRRIDTTLEADPWEGVSTPAPLPFHTDWEDGSDEDADGVGTPGSPTYSTDTAGTPSQYPPSPTYSTDTGGDASVGYAPSSPTYSSAGSDIMDDGDAGWQNGPLVFLPSQTGGNVHAPPV